MKKWLSVIAAVVLCLALVIGIACGGDEEEEAGIKKLKFGAGTPLVGAAGAACGVPVSYSWELAAEKIGEFEVAGERYFWEVIVENNDLSIAGGMASTNKLIYEHGVDLFMHQTGPDSANGALPITEELGIILDVGGASALDFGPDRPHYFQTSETWVIGAGPFFDWLSKEQPEIKVVVGTYNETAVGLAMGNAWKYAAEYYGLEVKREVVPFGAVEYYPVAAKLMTYDPDLVFGGLPLFKAMWEMGYEGLCLCDHWTETAAGAVPWDKAVGILFFYMPHPFGELFPEVTDFREEYEDRYGLELTSSAMMGANVLYVFTEVLKQAGTVDDVDKIIETMESGVSFDSLIGPVHYGLEELNGIGHCGIHQSPIYQLVGENEYQIMKVYTPEEVEAIVNAIYAER